MAKSFFSLTRHRSSSYPVSSSKLADSPNRGSCRSWTLLTLSITGGWLLSNFWAPVRAATMINNSGLQFDQDTTLDSNFLESHGAYQSTFGVMEVDTKKKIPLIVETKAADAVESIFKPSSFRNHTGTNTDFRGTPSNAVANPTARFTFKGNKRYVLYLESSFNGRPTGIVYSENVLNPNQEQQVKFTGGATDLCSSGVMVNWDDTGSKLVRNRAQQDRDFDDFIVQLKGTACAMGGGEPPEAVSQLPPAPLVGALPARIGRSRFPWEPLLLLGALPFLNGGRDKSSGSPGGPGGGVSSGKPGSGSPGGSSNTVNPICPNKSNCPNTPVPEPLTILGSGTAIAFGALIQRRRKRKS
jgi:hypothetical protein